MREDLKKYQNKRIGEENYNTFGTLMRIIKYEDAHNIIVEFQDEYKYQKHTRYLYFKKGEVKNVYDKVFEGVGFLGEGKYHKDGYKIIYRTWTDMIKRCYNPYYLNKQPTYRDCFVCDEWLNFQNFAKWYEENYYEVEGESTYLDKDILYKNNKLYSPNTCVFVTREINNLFTKRQNDRGEYPIGVTKRNNRKRLEVSCNVLDKRKFLGCFPLDKPFQAFTCYKQFKENYIKQVADKYKNFIPTKLYEAMYNYQVEIND